MEARWRAEERLADVIATGWGFGRHIAAMRRERLDVVNPFLEAHGPEVYRRMMARTRELQDQKRAELGRPASPAKALFCKTDTD
jgi:hypothetical protein